MRNTLRGLAALALAFRFAAPTAAQTFVIGVEQGAVFDAILDGFPNLAPLDGEPDFGGNALATSFKAGITEERAIGEFPLAALAAVDAQRIERATLTFNIDDVLSTFGPGTDFDGSAAEEILVSTYDGDGIVKVEDFLEGNGDSVAIDTRGFGTITDATLRTSGPIELELDITADVRQLVASGASFVGIVWRTMDTPTGTSLDDLGDGSGGPPGVNGSFLPFIRVELAADASPTPTSTPTPTDTPLAPTATTTPTASATSTITNSPTPLPTNTPSDGPCPGDCGDDRRVSVHELVKAVDMALRGSPVSECPHLDVNDDGIVGIDDLVRAVDASMLGC